MKLISQYSLMQKYTHSRSTFFIFEGINKYSIVECFCDSRGESYVYTITCSEAELEWTLVKAELIWSL